MTNGKKFDIYDRVMEFASKVALFVDKMPKGLVLIEYAKQLVRSSGSIGANMEEANGAVSRKDFVNKVGIARKEARESRHWLRLILKTGLAKSEGRCNEIDWLINEAKEIVLILSSIIKKTNEKK